MHIHTTIQVIYAEKGYYLWVGNIVTMSFTYFHLHLSAFTSSRIETAHSQPTKNTICHNGKKPHLVMAKIIFHRNLTLRKRINSTTSPYNLHSTSVSAPYHLRISSLPIDTEMIRTGYGFDKSILNFPF